MKISETIVDVMNYLDEKNCHQIVWRRDDNLKQ